MMKILRDNFVIIDELLKRIGYVPGEYFSVQIIRRGKDHPDLPSANRTFGSYYLEEPDDLEKYREEIIHFTEAFGCRAYIYPCRRSYQKAMLATIKEMSRRLLEGDCKKPWKIFDSASISVKSSVKLWIMDLDEPEHLEHIEDIKANIETIEPYEPVFAQVPTRTGMHLITRPFNILKFSEKWPDIDIKKTTSPTLLYCNI
jgi:hypothetical protein